MTECGSREGDDTGHGDDVDVVAASGERRHSLGRVPKPKPPYESRRLEIFQYHAGWLLS
jgi:hypothetical protein